MPLHLFNIFILYPGNVGGGLSVASIKKVKNFSWTRQQSQKVFQPSYYSIFMLHNTLLLNDACMRSTMKVVNNNTGYVGL